MATLLPCTVLSTKNLSVPVVSSTKCSNPPLPPVAAPPAWLEVIVSASRC